jgi:type IV pilus assembly protein PilE
MMKKYNIFTVYKPLSIKGFTLIELMITVAIVGILASLAYPSYSDFVMRSNRTEATRGLMQIANLQEQLFVDSRVYTNNLSQLQVSQVATFTTESGNYIINSVVIGNTFLLTATAQGFQFDRDNNCTAISIDNTGAKAPAICWEE